MDGSCARIGRIMGGMSAYDESGAATMDNRRSRHRDHTRTPDFGTASNASVVNVTKANPAVYCERAAR